jgi:hypothetical protein
MSFGKLWRKVCNNQFFSVQFGRVGLGYKIDSTVNFDFQCAIFLLYSIFFYESSISELILANQNLKLNEFRKEM